MHPAEDPPVVTGGCDRSAAGDRSGDRAGGAFRGDTPEDRSGGYRRTGGGRHA